MVMEIGLIFTAAISTTVVSSSFAGNSRKPTSRAPRSIWKFSLWMLLEQMHPSRLSSGCWQYCCSRSIEGEYGKSSKLSRCGDCGLEQHKYHYVRISNSLSRWSCPGSRSIHVASLEVTSQYLDDWNQALEVSPVRHPIVEQYPTPSYSLLLRLASKICKKILSGRFVNGDIDTIIRTQRHGAQENGSSTEFTAMIWSVRSNLPPRCKELQPNPPAIGLHRKKK